MIVYQVINRLLAVAVSSINCFSDGLLPFTFTCGSKWERLRSVSSIIVTLLLLLAFPRASGKPQIWIAVLYSLFKEVCES
jgi:hypothetical protein